MTVTQIRYKTRWANFGDLHAMAQLERDSFEFPYTHKDIQEIIADRHCFGFIAECGKAHAGHILYEVQSDRYVIQSICVATLFKRLGIGSTLIGFLTNKLQPGRREMVQIVVRESNLDAQLFLRSCGFKCNEILRNAYEQSDEAAYLFEVRV